MILLTTKQLRSIHSLIDRHLKGNYNAFFKSVWRKDLSVYEERLKSIGFIGHANVLDAGCGTGQWATCLATLNRRVSAIDNDQKKINSVRRILKLLGLKNIALKQQSVEKLSFADDQFDAVFAYQVLMYTDFRKTLSEFRRVLKPTGILYLCAPGLGWYLNCLVNPSKTSHSGNARRMAIDSLSSTFDFFATDKLKPKGQTVLPSALIRKELHKLGFETITVAPEGYLRVAKSKATSFYTPSVFAQENVYEILATKSRP